MKIKLTRGVYRGGKFFGYRTWTEKKINRCEHWEIDEINSIIFDFLWYWEIQISNFPRKLFNYWEIYDNNVKGQKLET